MKILALGDIVGEYTINKIKEELPRLIEKYEIDFVIANGENIVKARGINKKSFYELLEIGINAITMGNHTFSNSEIYELLGNANLIIPANFDEQSINNGYRIFSCKGHKIFVANLLGKNWGAKLNAFDIIEDILNKIPNDVKIRIIDFHGEYVNEKRSMLYFVEDKISALYGTHTHVQTADEQITKLGTGYITDIGMCGPKNSAIGYDIDFEIKRFRNLTQEDSRLSEDKNIILSGCIFDIDENTGNAKSIERIFIAN